MPRIESDGPVIPRSVIKPVPLGRTHASEVCTWVWVPQTADTSPSSYHARAAFSLVASAYISIRRILAAEHSFNIFFAAKKGS